MLGSACEFDEEIPFRYKRRVPKVTFLNEQITVEASAGKNLLEIAEESGIDVFRGIWPNLHCGASSGPTRSGWCGRCKVWLTERSTGAASARTSAEARRVRLNGALPAHGTMRLACQVIVQGDCDVRTRAGFTIRPNLTWEADPRSFKWRERWDHRNDEPAPKAGEAGASTAPDDAAAPSKVPAVE